MPQDRNFLIVEWDPWELQETCPHPEAEHMDCETRIDDSYRKGDK